MVLALNAKWRSQVVPGKSAAPAASGDDAVEAGEFLDEQGKGACGRYISWPLSHAMCFATPGRPVQWARLLKRVFNIDIETCVHCGGPLKMIAAIEDPPVIRKILIHLGLSPQPPPHAPARYDPYSEADSY